MRPASKARLTFETRVRVLAQGGKTTANGSAVTRERSRFRHAPHRRRHQLQELQRHHRQSATQLTTKTIAAAEKKPFTAIRDAHIKEHQRLFHRVNLDLGTTPAAKLPTDERIRNFANGDDPQLAALYFQFGRYLLISSSRPGGQPANLQGLWNESMNPPWGSKYTININTEMNYWPAEPTNLAEMRRPAHRDGHGPHRHRRAHRQGNVRRARLGGAPQHRSLARRRSHRRRRLTACGRPAARGSPCISGITTITPATKRSSPKPIPAMKGAAQFFLDTLVEEPKHHWLVTNPSLSPENQHPPGIAVVAGPTMDMQILRDLFADTIQAA